MLKAVRLFTSVASLALAGLPIAALATDAHAGAAVRIVVGDLDLKSPAARQAFEARVTAAADHLCRLADRPATDAPACRASAREEAIEGLSADQREDLRLARQALRRGPADERLGDLR